MTHRDALAKRLHAAVGVKKWDEIGIAQGIYQHLAAEALAYVDEVLGREKIIAAVRKVVVDSYVWGPATVASDVADAIRALLGLTTERESGAGR